MSTITTPPARSVVDEALEYIIGTLVEHLQFTPNSVQLRAARDYFRRIIGDPDYTAAVRLDQIFALLGGLAIMFQTNPIFDPELLAELHGRLEALLGS